MRQNIAKYYAKHQDLRRENIKKISQAIVAEKIKDFCGLIYDSNSRKDEETLS